MISFRYQSIVRLFSRQRENHTLAGVLSPVEFRDILERERARVDRNGHEFSLVAFGVWKEGKEPVVPLAHVLTNRTRSTDQVGWLNSRYLGVLLPDTPAQGARKFAEDVCGEFAVYASAPPFTIYTYPSKSLPSGHGDPTQFGNTDSHASSSRNNTNGSLNFMMALGPLLDYGIPLWKRIIDILGAVFGLILLFPAFLLIAAFIKIVSPGPIFFKQTRFGHLGKPFTCWKFRTMRTGADITCHQEYLCSLINGGEPMTKLDQDADPRIIPFGNFLRQTGLDELPQLFNVLLGDMSLIGPRPCLPYEAQEYELWQTKRFYSIPGLTGLWQVSGKNRTTFKQMIRLDINYLAQRSVRLDLKILFKTVPAVVSQIADGLFKRKEREYAESN